MSITGGWYAETIVTFPMPPAGVSVRHLSRRAACARGARRQKVRPVSRRREDLKTDAARVFCRTTILLEVRRAHCPHSQAHKCPPYMSAVYHPCSTGTCISTCTHVHMHIACCTLSNPDHDRYFDVIPRYISPLPLFITRNICPLLNIPLGSNNFEM